MISTIYRIERSEIQKLESRIGYQGPGGQGKKEMLVKE